MAPQVSQSQILNKLKLKSKGGWKKARTVEAKARAGGGLPPGLKGAVCRLKEYKLSETNDDRKVPYFSLTGIVLEPEECKDQRCTFQWFISDSDYGTVQDELNKLSNDLQLIYMKEMPESEAEILNVLKELCDDGICVVFNTNKPKNADRMPRPFVQGLAEGYDSAPYAENGSAGDSPDDGAEAGEETAGDEEPVDPEEAANEEGAEEGGDEAGDGDGDSTGEAEETPWEPAAKDQYTYPSQEKDPKGKARVVKVQVTVLAVNKRKQTMDLQQLFPGKKKGEWVTKNPANGKPGKVWKNVDWECGLEQAK